MIVKRRIKILQQRMLGVFLTQDSVFRRNTPVNTQRIVQNAVKFLHFIGSSPSDCFTSIFTVMDYRFYG